MASSTSRGSFVVASSDNEIDVRRERDLRRKRLKLATGVVVAYTTCAIAKAMCFHNADYVDRDVLSRRRIDRNSLMDRLTQLSDRDCRDQLRMGVDAFAKLCRLFRDTGRLGDTLHSSIEEKVARFLLIISHYWKNRTVRFFFMRSGETVSRHFHQVLEALISLEDHFIKQPDGAQTPLEIETNPRFWPYLKDCVGAIDGSHIRAKVSEHDVKRYRGRKEHPTQNVLAVCTFDLRICYILAGWEGSASDSRILNSAIAKQIDPLDMEKSASGFSFNRTTRMMDAAPKVWDAYLESHPKARSFRNKKVPCFENLVLLFGADRATGHDAETAKEKRLRLEREKNEVELVFLGDKKVEEIKGVSSGPANNEMELSIESSEVPSSSRGSKKRKGGASGGSNLHEEFKMMRSSLDTIASAYGQSSPRVILEDEIFMEVKKIEGLNEDAMLIAYDFICGDPVRGRTFVGLPINLRKRWLEIKLGCDFGKI